jgi:hypothetical protein
MIDGVSIDRAIKLSSINDSAENANSVPGKTDCRLDGDMQDGYCNVETAARILGKSIRQTQRLLNQRQLKGRRVQGRRGQEWQVDRASLTIQPKGRFNAFQRSIMNRLSALEFRFEEVIALIQSLEQRIDSADL